MAERELTEEEVADLKEAFAMFDINGDGRFRASNLVFSPSPVFRMEAFSIQQLCTHCFFNVFNYACVVDE